MLGNASDELDALLCALAVIVPFFVGGLFQTAFKHPVSDRFASPIDGGAIFLGQPLFGVNKTWRGFVVLIPVTTLTFRVDRGNPRPHAGWSLALESDRLVLARFLLGFGV